METERLIVDYFRETALGNENPAVRWGDGSCLSWDALYGRAHRLARNLISECGLQRGDCVAIGLERSAEYLVASYAVWLAGAVYFPVDPKTPLARMASMFATAACDIAFCAESHQALFAQARPSMRLISGDSLAKQCSAPMHAEEAFPAALRLQATDPAYLLFTSGTTGTPKGVLVNHGALINRLSWHRQHSELSHRDIILQRTALTFDVSLWELFLPALCGASNYLLSPGWEAFPRGIVAALERAQITIAHFVPSLLKPVLQELGDTRGASPLPALRRVYVSGESLLPSLVEGFYGVFESRCTLTNLYGPTEAAIDVTFYDCAPGMRAAIPIGRPLAGCRLYVVDPCTLALKAEGETGEIAIGGVCLADGYHKQEELTAKAFVFHPELQERLYLTGDLGWYEAGDTFFCEGRKDTQVKLRGLRIELGEIEHRLLEHPTITEAVACIVEDEFQEQWLVAAIVAGTKLDPQEVRRFLGVQLPAYMLPARYWQTRELPRSSSGKLDRKAIERSVRASFFDRSAREVASPVS
jgi:amino acid adenylation domain-containing protein